MFLKKKIIFHQTKIKNKIKFELRKIGILSFPGIAQDICIGDGIEVGALSYPARLPKANKILYADVGDKQKTKQQFKDLGYKGYIGKHVDVDIFFGQDKPPLEKQPDCSVDFIYSNNSLEHSANPISTLIDYLRVVKKGGIVYTIIPNKEKTYDKNRLTTNISVLIDKYNKNIWSYSLDEFKELYENTIDHEVYRNKHIENIKSEWKRNSGLHHIHTFDLKLTSEIVSFITKYPNYNLRYFTNHEKDIHFALVKE